MVTVASLEDLKSNFIQNKVVHLEGFCLARN